MPHRTFVFALAYFASVFAAGFALGVVRTLWIAPALGPLAAVALELPLMLGVSWWVAGRLRARWPLMPLAAIAAGALAFAMLMLAELGVSTGVAGRDLAAHLALYRQPEAQLGLVGQLLFAAMPGLRARKIRT